MRIQIVISRWGHLPHFSSCAAGGALGRDNSSASRGIRRLSFAADPSTIDTLGAATVFVHRHQSDVLPNIRETNSFKALGSNVQLSSTASSGQMLALASTSSVHPGRIQFVVVSVALTAHSLPLHDNTIETTFHSQDGASFNEVTPTNTALVENRPEWEPRGISPDPSVQFSRKVWWVHLLDLYAVSVWVSYGSPQELARRDGGVSQITDDVPFIFRSFPYWFSILKRTSPFQQIRGSCAPEPVCYFPHWLCPRYSKARGEHTQMRVAAWPCFCEMKLKVTLREACEPAP